MHKHAHIDGLTNRSKEINQKKTDLHIYVIKKYYCQFSAASASPCHPLCPSPPSYDTITITITPTRRRTKNKAILLAIPKHLCVRYDLENPCNVVFETTYKGILLYKLKNIVAAYFLSVCMIIMIIISQTTTTTVTLVNL